MTCKPKIEPDSYDFFQKIKNYIFVAEKVVSDGPLAQSSEGCTSFFALYKSQNSQIAKDIYNEFTKLYNLLFSYKNNPRYSSDYKHFCGFLNYWLNSKLKESKFDGTACVIKFYENMKLHCKDTFPVGNSLNFIYDINEDDLKKMNILYKLHEQISKIHKILFRSSEEEPNSSLSLSKESLQYYRTYSPTCNGNNSEFCKALQDFKDKYKQLYSIFQRRGEEYTKYYIKLPEVNNNIILTPLLCTVGGLIPLLGILYKFTPMGQIFRSKNKKFTKEYSNNYDNSKSLHQERYNVKYDSVA
ncbi:PIR protein [Plasmodium vivax]|uniref:VIR protein n=1 Tax=Plasmodium vivax TaxID=5855 RepID=A0A565A6E7_PLAVI|nr:PIR protein [Plasmodium vivax]